MPSGSYEVRPIGWVESELIDPASAPLQGDEGAPDAWIVIEPGVVAGLKGLQVGNDIIVLTWLDRASRDVLAVHPRGDATRAERGVFTTRSPDRPNPIGLHRVTIREIEGRRILVSRLEAIDRTPVLDLKPVLEQIAER